MVRAVALSENTNSSLLTTEGAERASLDYTFIFLPADIRLEESVALSVVKSKHEERKCQKADPQKSVWSGKA